MCTLTISYDTQNALAVKLVELLHTSGVFAFTEEDDMTEKKEKEAFLYTSRVNASKMFAKYL